MAITRMPSSPGDESAWGEAGATATEYALLVSFIALALVLGVTFFGTELNVLYNGFATALAAVL